MSDTVINLVGFIILQLVRLYALIWTAAGPVATMLYFFPEKMAPPFMLLKVMGVIGLTTLVVLVHLVIFLTLMEICDGTPQAPKSVGVKAPGHQHYMKLPLPTITRMTAAALLALPVTQSEAELLTSQGHHVSYNGAIIVTSSVDSLRGLPYESITVNLWIKLHLSVEINGMTGSTNYAFVAKLYYMDAWGNPVYDTGVGYNGNRVHSTRSPFHYDLSKQEYVCPSSSGLSYFYKRTSTQFMAGYEVTKPADTPNYAAPNPLRTSIHWTTLSLPSSCQDWVSQLSNPVDWSFALPRYSLAEVWFPGNDALVTQVFMRPVSIGTP